jgi:hypothetical protein
MLLQASATVVGVFFLPPIAVVVYLAVSIFFVVDPLRHVRCPRPPPGQDQGQCRWVSTRSLSKIMAIPRPSAIEVANSSSHPRS